MGHTISSVEQLHALYGRPAQASLVKVASRITPEYARFIEASPFVALASAGPEGLDCSPRGDLAGFVRIADPQTLMLPDRRGNNRCDSLENVVRDPRVALLFLIPGSNTTFRVNGRAVVSVDPALLDSFIHEGKPPRSVLVISVVEAYFQCGRAIIRSALWDEARQVDPASLPSAGEILAAMSEAREGGPDYDAAWASRAQATLW